MKFVSAFFLSMVVYAQPITISCGSPSDQYFSPGSVAWSMPAGVSPAFLRYAPSFSYDIPLAVGLYNISVVMVEPNATAAGKRVFAVAAQGQVSAPLDLFALAGADNVAYALPMMALVGAGVLHLQFVGSVGNAVVSQIIVTPAPSSAIISCSCSDPVLSVSASQGDGTIVTASKVAGNAIDLVLCASSGGASMAGETLKVAGNATVPVFYSFGDVTCGLVGNPATASVSWQCSTNIRTGGNVTGQTAMVTGSISWP